MLQEKLKERKPPLSISHEHLLNEALRRMNRTNPMHTRLELVKELCEFATSYRCAKIYPHYAQIISLYLIHFYHFFKTRMDDVLTVWATVKDLVEEEQPPEVREIGFQAMNALINGQYQQLGTLRLGTMIHRFPS